MSRFVALRGGDIPEKGEERVRKEGEGEAMLTNVDYI